MSYDHWKTTEPEPSAEELISKFYCPDCWTICWTTSPPQPEVVYCEKCARVFCVTEPSC